MSSQSDRHTRFSLNLPGFTVEIEGEREFVEELYHKISSDLSPILSAAEEGRSPSLPDDGSRRADVPKKSAASGFSWVYIGTRLFNKVYVAENSAVEASPLGRFIDVDRLRRIYLDSEQGELFAGLTSHHRTLWAEFTEAGREMIRSRLAEAAQADQADSKP